MKLAAILALALIGCESTPPTQAPVQSFRRVEGPGGRSAWVVWCDNSMASCWEISANLCRNHGGYDVLDSRGTPLGSSTVAYSERFGRATNGVSESRSVTRNQLLIRCRDAA